MSLKKFLIETELEEKAVGFDEDANLNQPTKKVYSQR